MLSSKASEIRTKTAVDFSTTLAVQASEIGLYLKASGRGVGFLNRDHKLEEWRFYIG